MHRRDPRPFGPEPPRLAPRSLSAKERRERDEEAILLEVIRAEIVHESRSVYVGIQRDREVIDPTPEMMRSLQASKTDVKPVSDLLTLLNVKAGTKIWPDPRGKKPGFTLFRAYCQDWKGADQVSVYGGWDSSSGSGCARDYTVFRRGTIHPKKTDKVTQSGWILRDLGSGRSGWGWLRIGAPKTK